MEDGASCERSFGDRSFKRRAAQLAADDVRTAGFAPAPPAVLECIAGPEAGRRLHLEL